ncbi:MAG: response regulator [Desulfomonile tiedjei]|uniref:histidine kinase n=1 Tax=Desulfomonile tiedjei TaxID=2358 RepID=A0A9D6UZY1_9BACT|nr:response regulator [Desulfomonile tiedjei]
MFRVKRALAFRYPQPMKVLTIGLLLSATALPVLGSIVWSMYESISRIAVNELKLQRIIGAVAHLDEVLTMHARLAAATGDLKWEHEYRKVEPELDAAILEVAMQAREEYEKNYASQTKLAYTKLIELESLAFALVRNGRQKEASELLFNQEYDRQKALYSQGIMKMTEAVEKRISQEIDSFRQRILHTGLLMTASLMLLLVAWLGVSWIVRRHITLRRQAEEKLEGEKERLAVTLRSIGDGVITTDTLGRVELMNRVAEDLTGWRQDEALGRALDEVFVIINEKTREQAQNPVEKVLESGSICGLANHTVLIARNGSERAIADSGAPIRDRKSNIVGVVLVFRDVSEQQLMLKEVLKAEKLESVGILAGGIAHDFNNILTAILGNLSLAKMEAPPQSKVFKRLSEAERASIRARGLTQQLLTFSKGGVPIKRIAPIQMLLQEWVMFALRGSNVKCEFRIQDDLWHVEIDEGQVSQVIHNLIINADQAMPNGGRIHVSAENHVEPDGNGSSLTASKYVKISVTDDGVGVAPEHIPKIFDPYFTTKDTGSGLGLATSYAAIRRHGGHITVDSDVGVGTTFCIFLPASESRALPASRSSEVVQPRGGRILVMDDEPLIRDVASQMLTSLGFEVSTSKDGTEAITLYRTSREQGEPFDAVIMDLTIPGGMGGKEAIRELRDLDPEIKVIVSSGYCNDPIMGDFREYGFSGVLVKPYNAREMNEILHSLVNRANN